jgi:hypothetical protein
MRVATFIAAAAATGAHAMCDSYCRNPCPNFAAAGDTIVECSDCGADMAYVMYRPSQPL